MLTTKAVTQIIPNSAGKPIKPIKGAKALAIRSTIPVISNNLIIKTKGIKILYKGIITSLISCRSFLSLLS